MYSTGPPEERAARAELFISHVYVCLFHGVCVCVISCFLFVVFVAARAAIGTLTLRDRASAFTIRPMLRTHRQAERKSLKPVSRLLSPVSIRC